MGTISAFGDKTRRPNRYLSRTYGTINQKTEDRPFVLFKYNETALDRQVVIGVVSSPINLAFKMRDTFAEQGWVSRRVVSACDIVNASYLPTTTTIYDLEINTIN